MDAETKKTVIEYVKEESINSAGTKKIKEFCESQPPVSKTVFRGHKRSQEIRFNKNWYSATENKTVAKEEFASANCCVFTIHLVDIPVIDVNAFVGDEIDKYKEEEECIFLGGGSFYKDRARKVAGFTEKTPGEFECWYVLDKEKPASPSRKTSIEKTIFGLIPDDEYEFIDSPGDIVFPQYALTLSQKRKVYTMVKEKRRLGSDAGKQSRKLRKLSLRHKKQKEKKKRRRTCMQRRRSTKKCKKKKKRKGK